MSKRLVQVAKELNVGTKTIVDFLNTQGFSVSNKPTAKVSSEQYDLLVRNFQKSMAIKEKANKIAIGTTRKKDDGGSGRKKRPSIKPLLKSTPPPRQEEENKENKVDEPPVPQNKQESNKTEEPDIKVNAPQVTGPKVVGKIDLDALDNKKSKVENKASKKDNNKTTPTKKVEVKNQEEKKQEPKAPEKKEEPKVVKQEQPKEVAKTEKTPPTEQKKVETENKGESNSDATTTSTDTDATNAEGAENVDIKVNAPQLKGLKILGKINIEPRKRRRKKDKNTSSRNSSSGNNDNKSRRPNRNNDQKDGDKKRQESTSGTGNNSNNRRGRGNRTNDNRGNDNRNNRNNQNDNRSNDNRNNNRNRSNQNDNRSGQDDNTRTPQTSNSGSGNNSNNSTTNNNDSSRKKRRKKIKIAPKGSDSNNNNNSNNDDDKGKRRRKGGKRKEITKKEIDESIKATMALMRGGKKRKKSGSTRSERDERKEKRLQQEQVEQEEVKKLQVTEFISVSELANLMEVSATEVIMACMKSSIYVSINQRLDTETIELVAMEYGYEVEFISAEDQIESEYEEPEDDEADLKPRSPIVTVMGHVDHGKTSLLDRIREAKVADDEAGGITQHIGAYEVEVGDMGRITFLDTPGHEAFTAMRARGAQVTDVAVIIIAADDNIMPQTKEAISHAQAANVPIIFAINKIDKEGANPERVKQELASLGFLVEDWGGKYQSQDISAKKNINIDLLLEKILLESEMLELKANPDRLAYGTVLEASMEKGRGYVTKILVQSGTLTDGEPIIAGHHSGRVRAMFNEFGKRVKKAGPSTPVLILGLQGAPQAGERIKVMPSERDAKELANKRGQLARQQQIRATRRITLGELNRRLQVGNFQELNLIVKGDMDGSVEALSDSLLKLANEQVQTRIVHKAVGPISESDVNLAAASDAIIIGFQVRPNPMAKKLAENEGVEIKTYSIIYDAIEEITSALEGMLEPKQVEEELGQVEIQHVFNISKVGKVAGCFVREGKIQRNSHVRVIRDGIVMYPKKEGVHGKLASLKRFKDNVSEVKAGFECGLSVEGFDKIREGDIVEAYTIKEVKQTLDD